MLTLLMVISRPYIYLITLSVIIPHAISIAFTFQYNTMKVKDMYFDIHSRHMHKQGNHAMQLTVSLDWRLNPIQASQLPQNRCQSVENIFTHR